MEQTEEKTVGRKIIDTIEKYRVVIISVLIGAILVAIVIGVLGLIKNNAIEKGLMELDQIEYKYSGLDTTSETISEDKLSIYNEALELANDSTDIVSVRSFLFAGNIASELENYAEARDAYVHAYEAKTESYTAPMSLFNAAMCSDELNELDLAVEYLEKVSGYEDFSLMPRAMFNLGRIQEARNSNDEALVVYEQVAADYPDSSWAKLAMSRKIALTIQ